MPLISLVIPPFHDTTLATASLNLAHGIRRYCQSFVVFEARSISKASVTLVAVNPGNVFGAGRNSRIGVTPVLRASLTALVARRAYAPPRHSSCRVIYDVVMLAVIK
jgi:hypothetical protein